jgi:thioredoxin reductase (NADPH)
MITGRAGIARDEAIMLLAARALLEARSAQMFPILGPPEIARIQRFGSPRSYRAGERLVSAGEISAGLFVILSGEVAVTQSGPLGPRELLVTHRAGSVLGEVAQLAGRPAMVDADAQTPVEALVIPSPRIHDLLVADAELGEVLMRALILRRVGLLQTGVGGPVVVGPAEHPDVLRLAGFLARNGQPHQQLDPRTDPDARAVIERFHVDPADLPIVVCTNGAVLRNPTESAVATCLQLVRPLDPNAVFDVAIVGAGPAGLAAAVYAASEGLSVLVLDARAFGGQAGASSRIENYLGFPTGISGIALMARAFNQALKFGAEAAIPDRVVAVRCGERAGGGGPVELVLADGEHARARALVVASGAAYRRLEVEHLAQFEGSAVHYWASPLEAKLCAGAEVALVGAGNSAGQAAVYLAGQARQVSLIARGASLERTMSRYLVERIAALPNVEVFLESSVSRLEGAGGTLDAVRWVHAPTGAETRRPTHHLFLFIGADPNTGWLAGSGVALDPKGFVLTGAEAGPGRRPLETSAAGIFAIGDVRAGSTKRVAAAVGEGAQVIAAIHAYLGERGAKATPVPEGRAGVAAAPPHG